MKDKLFNRLELKDFEEAKGVISFYYGAFNNEDLGGDVLLPSACKKTVAENFKHIYHNRDHSEAVGKPLEFSQDAKGPFCVSQLAVKTEDGGDCFEQYKAGIVKGHSMEYNAIKWAYDEQKNIRTLSEIMLWGVTTVTNIPMNLDATTISIKSYTEIKYQMEEIERFLRVGNISEKSGRSFLEQYAKLEILAKSLQDKLKAGDTTLESKASEPKKGFDYNYLKQNLTLK